MLLVKSSQLHFANEQTFQQKMNKTSSQAHETSTSAQCSSDAVKLAVVRLFNMYFSLRMCNGDIQQQFIEILIFKTAKYGLIYLKLLREFF